MRNGLDETMVTNAGERTRATVEYNRRVAVRMRTEGLSYREIGEQLRLSKQRAQQLVREALAELPRESAEQLITVTFERMEMCLAAAHDGAALRVPLRDRNGTDVLDENGEVILVPPEPSVHLAYLSTAFRFAEQIAKFGGVGNHGR